MSVIRETGLIWYFLAKKGHNTPYMTGTLIRRSISKIQISDIWELNYIVVWRALCSKLSCLIITQKTLYSAGSKKSIHSHPRKSNSSQCRLKSIGTVVHYSSQLAFEPTHARCSTTPVKDKWYCNHVFPRKECVLCEYILGNAVKR